MSSPTFDAVYVATGAGGDSFGLLESWDADSVHHLGAQGVHGRQPGGATLMEAIAQGLEASKIIEVFLQTGRSARAPTAYDKEGCGRYLEHEGVVPAPRVEASRPAEGYSEREAQAEADRVGNGTALNLMSAFGMLKRAGDEEFPIAGSNNEEPFSLSQNYPNPFNPQTPCPPSAAIQVSVQVFNILGQLVTTLVEGEMAAGSSRTASRDARGMR